MSKDVRVYLVQILERMARIERYATVGSDSFFNDTLIQDGIIRNLEVIGEAAKRISDDFRSQHPMIPWRSLAALRDVLIHQYEGVDVREVWRVVQDHLPRLKDAIAQMLPPLAQLENEIAGDGEMKTSEG